MKKSIDYPEDKYLFYANQTDICISPQTPQFFDCSISPSLPAGLSFTNTCEIKGIMPFMNIISFKITSKYPIDSIGYIMIGNPVCKDVLLYVKRLYGEHSHLERWSLIAEDNGDVIANDSTGNRSSQNMSITAVCVSESRLRLELYGDAMTWDPNSWIIIWRELDGKQEYLIKAQYDSSISTGNVIHFCTWGALEYKSIWSYYMASVPHDWLKCDIANWYIASRNHFPSSDNQIQLYRRVMIVNWCDNIMGLVISVKFRSGVVIYINENELIRVNVVGIVGSDVMATKSYLTAEYHRYVLPSSHHCPGTHADDDVNYIHMGINQLAVAIIGESKAATQSVFDMSIRFLIGTEYAYVSNLVTTIPSTLTVHGTPFLSNRHSSIDSSGDHNDAITFLFDNKDMNWVNCVELVITCDESLPLMITVRARQDGKEWVVLLQEMTLLWWELLQVKRVMFVNSVGYGEYIVEIMHGSGRTGAWSLSSIALLAVVPKENYRQPLYPTSFSAIVGVSIPPFFPTSSNYILYDSTPTLPSGLTMDYTTGIIIGIPSISAGVFNVTITAMQMNGETVSEIISMEVIDVTDKSIAASFTVYITDKETFLRCDLLSVDTSDFFTVFSISSFPYSYHSYEIRSVVKEGRYVFVCTRMNGVVPSFPSFASADLRVISPTSHGLFQISPAFSMGPFYYNTSQILISFSTDILLSGPADIWAYTSSSTEIPKGWMTPLFDDSDWTISQIIRIDSIYNITAYFRESVFVKKSGKETMLMMKVRFHGGVGIYFNGRIVAVYNMKLRLKPDQYAIDPHNTLHYSSVGIPLNYEYDMEERSVISVENHRSSLCESNFVSFFDLVVVMLKEYCVMLYYVADNVSIDSGLMITSHARTVDNPTGDDFYVVALHDKLQITWESYNMVGFVFNTISVSCGLLSNINLLWEIYGYNRDYNQWFLLTPIVSITMKTGITEAFVEGGTMGVSKVKLLIRGSEMRIYQIRITSAVLSYRSNSQLFCKSIDDFPAVEIGHFSVLPCASGFIGYKTRFCDENQKWTDIKATNCVLQQPRFFSYSKNQLVVFFRGVSRSISPSLSADTFTVVSKPSLPQGIVIDSSTGVIGGIPVIRSPPHLFSILASNSYWAIDTELIIKVVELRCRENASFPAGIYGDSVWFNCWKLNRIGIIKIRCVDVGSDKGQWEGHFIMCFSLPATITLFSIVAVFIYWLLFSSTMSRKRKVRRILRLSESMMAKVADNLY